MWIWGCSTTPPRELHPRSYFTVIKNTGLFHSTGKARGSQFTKILYCRKYVYSYKNCHSYQIMKREPNQGLRPTGGRSASKGEGDSTKIRVHADTHGSHTLWYHQNPRKHSTQERVTPPPTSPAPPAACSHWEGEKKEVTVEIINPKCTTKYKKHKARNSSQNKLNTIAETKQFT